MAQPDGCRFVCTPSHQRRVRGLGRRTQERLEHDVLPACFAGLWLVCAQARPRPLSLGRLRLCFVAALEAAGGHVSISPLTVGLLAPAPDRHSLGACGSSAGHGSSQVFMVMVATREVAPPAALGCQRADGDEGSETRGRPQRGFPIQPAVAPGDSCHFLRAIPWESILAIESSRALSRADRVLSGGRTGCGGSFVV